MECRKSDRLGYIDFFYRIDHTPNLLLFQNIGSDSSLMKIAFKYNFFADKHGSDARCKRISQKYRKYGITYTFTSAFSDSEGVILDFINRMKKVQTHIKAEIKKQLLNSEIDTEYKRKLVCKIIGDDLVRRTKLERKTQNHIEVISAFIGSKY